MWTRRGQIAPSQQIEAKFVVVPIVVVVVVVAAAVAIAVKVVVVMVVVTFMYNHLDTGELYVWNLYVEASSENLVPGALRHQTIPPLLQPSNQWHILCVLQAWVCLSGSSEFSGVLARCFLRYSLGLFWGLGCLLVFSRVFPLLFLHATA